MKRSPILLLLPLLPLMAGCDGQVLGVDKTYHYQGFDEAGNVLVVGTLHLEYGHSGDSRYPVEIRGTWNFEQHLDGEHHLGPQIGKGDLEGSMRPDGQFWIGLNPGVADNNVNLTGHFVGGRYGDFEGDWAYSTLFGVAGQGRFEATRR